MKEIMKAEHINENEVISVLCDANDIPDINKRMVIGSTYDIEIYYNGCYHKDTSKWVKCVKIYGINEHGDYDISYRTSDGYYWQGLSGNMNISAWKEVRG